MARYMAEEKESTFFLDVFKIALGVFIGGFLAALAYTQFVAWNIERSFAQVSLESKTRLENERRQIELNRLQQVNRAQLQEAETREKAAAARAHEEQMRAMWRQMYKRTAACEADPTTMVCVNAHAAAHKRFTETYGELPPRF